MSSATTVLARMAIGRRMFLICMFATGFLTGLIYSGRALCVNVSEIGKEARVLRVIIQRSRISRLNGVFIFLLESLNSILLRAPSTFSHLCLIWEYSKTELPAQDSDRWDPTSCYCLSGPNVLSGF